MLRLLSRHVRICSPSLHNPQCQLVPSSLPSLADTVSQHCFRCVDSHSRQDLPSFSIHANQLSHCSIHNNCTVAYYITLHYITFLFITLHYITAAVGRAHIAPTQTIATPCGPALPLFPLRRKVQSLAGLSTLYLSSACVACLGDGAFVVPSGASGGASQFGAYG